MIDLKEGCFLLIDKPYTWTSFQVVNKIKYKIRNLTKDKKFKIGHAGTLDPLATGLLIICVGHYTKKIQEFQDFDKEYIGSFCLGATTKSFDKEHEVDNTYPTNHIKEDLIYQTASSFIGIQEQVPPVYSAIKIDGKRAYEYAREENEVEIKKKTIEIKEFEITQVNMPEVKFRVVCSKGTYIRSLARDFGLRLNSGAYLSSLRRTRIGDFHIEQAKQIDDLDKEIIE